MIEIRNFSGGLDRDSSLYDVAKGWYLSALNITKNSVSENNDYDVTNIVGNLLQTYTLPDGTNKCIGAFPHTLRNTVIYFVYNSLGHHSVLEYNHTTGITVRIFESLLDSATDILGFTENNKITSVNVYPRDEGDLLFFLDSLGRPTQMDITLFKAGAYTLVTREIIDVIKVPPLIPPASIYGNATTVRSNDLRTKLCRFKYLWVYDDFSESCCSPIGDVPLPGNILDETYTSIVTNNNIIYVSVSTGGKAVKEIQLLVSVADKKSSWSDFAVVETINKSNLSIIDDSDYTYYFYNNSTYPTKDINHSILLFDWLPDKANAMCMPNGNVLMFGGITEGLNKEITPNVVVTVGTVSGGSGGSGGSLVGVLTTDKPWPNIPYVVQRMEWAFSGIPAAGTVVSIKVRRKSDGLEFNTTTYTTLAGDSAVTVAQQLIANNTGPSISVSYSNVAEIRLDIPYSTYEILPGSGLYSELTVTPPSSSLAPNSTATWKWSTSRFLGIVYFNSKGKTNGVLYSSPVVFPAYAETAGVVLLPYINVKIYHVPPSWATSWQFVFSKEPTQYIFLVSQAVKNDSSYIYFDISNLTLNQTKNPTTAEVVSYTFQDGDRLRLIKDVNAGTVYPDTYDASIEGVVVDPKIGGVTVLGSFVKIKNVDPFSGIIGSIQNFVIELYRIGQQPPNAENLPFYELGEQYPTVLDSLGVLVHGGELSNQDTATGVPAEVSIAEGDSYFRIRNEVLSETGIASFAIQDRNFVDFYTSAVNTVDGRAHVIDKNAKQAYYSTLVRFGGAYQPNTNINNLPRFYPNNFDEYDYNFGDIIRLTVRNRYVKVFQKFKIGVVPLFGQITKDATGNESLVVTDSLINPIQYRIGNFGLTSPESLASWHFSDYGCDTNKGVVWRDSNDGVIPISELYKMSSWATVELPLRTGNYKIYGTINPRSNEYILALEATPTSLAQTVSFSEQTNSFDSFLSYNPEMMVALGVTLISFLNGGLYTHNSTVYNTFFGVEYPSYIKTIFNGLPTTKKTFVALTENANVIWECPEIITQVKSYGTTPQQSNLIASDFENEEGQYNAALLKDVNSVTGGAVVSDYHVIGTQSPWKIALVSGLTSNIFVIINFNAVLNGVTILKQGYFNVGDLYMTDYSTGSKSLYYDSVTILSVSGGGDGLINGDELQGKWATIKFNVDDATNLIILSNVGLKSLQLALNTK